MAKRIKRYGYGLSKAQKEMITIIKRDYPETAKKLLYEMANRTLARVKLKTPVDEGFLRRGWQLGEIYEEGDQLLIELLNVEEYAPYVEFGYQQKKGQFVPALGKTLTGKFIKGKFMLTLSIKELERDMPRLVRKFYNEVMGEFR